MRRLFAALSFLLFSSLLACTSSEIQNPKTSIFYSPHADDEVLSLGSAILHQINQGNEVVVVLLSKGEASSSFTSINEKLVSTAKNPITRQEFGNARVKEFKNSVDELGIQLENTYTYDLPDGQITKEEVIKIIQEMSVLYPSASHHTLSYLDPHSDHANAGLALKSVQESGEVNSVRFYLPIQEFNKMKYKGTYYTPSNYKDAYFNGLNSYNIWDPKNGFYAIGYTSVQSYFQTAKKLQESRWHQ
ncbi:PIG-L deacetylase family protein [Bacillus sp. 2205SS5-2]|uniref:PIG-L deacetylase family protein n=1 Tax=Bacillus sp. 2205SS5-2 TaxID=3109031 RepID=UPI0030056F08